MSFDDTYDFVITRKPEPPEPPSFFCEVCEETIQPDRWSRREMGSAPVCRSCQKNWGGPAKVKGVTRADTTALQRLRAVTARLNWEIMNGRYSPHRIRAD